MALKNTDLQDSCDKILLRLQQRNIEEFACVVCPVRVRGQDALMEHMILEHQVKCIHFDDVVDLDGFLSLLRERIVEGGAEGHWRCPVCLAALSENTPDSLKSHMQEHGHQAWNPDTIEALRPFCMASNSLEDDEGDDDDDVCKAAANVNNVEDESLESGDEWEEECLCLFCSYEATDCLEHMAEVHKFDMRTITCQRDDVKDEYDLIWLINVVRRRMHNKECPFGGSECAADVTAKGGCVETHLLEHAEHRLPAIVSRTSDRELIPVLPGDALISLVVSSGEGFLKSQDADPDFPMVPTVQELAAARAKKQ